MTDHHHQTAVTGKVFFMRLQVNRQPIDLLRQNGGLHLCGTGIAFLAPNSFMIEAFVSLSNILFLPILIDLSVRADVGDTTRPE